MTELVAGVDGGGTRTRVVIATPAGEELGAGVSGSGNLHDVGAHGLADHLNAAVSDAFAAAGMAPRRVNAVFLGLGSIVTADDQATIRSIVAAAPWAPNRTNRIGVDHDLRIALEGCLAGRPGIVLVAGTGSAAFGRTRTGASWKAGGWGPLLDDVGSGHWLGRQAMIAAIRAFDGRGRDSMLADRVLAELGLSSPLEILRRVELEGMSRSEIADLARLVLEAAKRRDVAAEQIIDQGADALAELVATVSDRLIAVDASFRPVVAATGGLVAAGDVFMEPLTAAFARRVPQVEICAGIASPVIGAVMLALELFHGGAIDDVVLDRLLQYRASI